MNQKGMCNLCSPRNVGCLNNNAIESWNNLMCSLRKMPISWLVSGHLQKLGIKFEKQKMEMQNWKNVVGEKVETKLHTTLGQIGAVSEIKLFNTALKEYGVELTNSRRLVVSLSRRTRSCKWWQLWGLPCLHTMDVIQSQKLLVYDFVSDYCKSLRQGKIYLNLMNPMETHDSG